MTAFIKIVAMLWFWWFYYDDWFARLVGNPEVGQVPFFPWFLGIFIFQFLLED